jgi:hypothetical protein
MNSFLQRHKDRILGVLSAFDRIRFRGSLRRLSYVGGVLQWLAAAGVLLKDFLPLTEQLTKRLHQEAEQFAAESGRPVQYLESKVDKEALVRQIGQRQESADNGVVAVLKTLETCRSYDIFRQRQTQTIELRRRVRKCLHYYFYFEDGRFGLTQVRLMSWFPFDCHVVLNGREWLARQMDQAGLGYLRRDNCFVNLEDFERAQRLANQQPRIAWCGQLDRVLRRVYSGAGQFHGASRPLLPQPYYWTSEQTEWATDVVFRDMAALAELYPSLTRHGIETFQSPDVLRFLGQKLPAHGGVHGRFAGEIVSDLKERPEGVRIKHRLGRNTLKMYDKFGSVLRVETTLNDPRGLKVYRPKSDDAEGPKEWLPLRKSVADLARRSALSQSANTRYLEALGKVDVDAPLSSLTDKLCRPVVIVSRDAAGGEKSRRYRALRPFDPEEVKLLEVVSRGEYELSGFRNRDVRAALYGGDAGQAVGKPDSAEAVAARRRVASRVSRKLALLRAHGLIKKVPRTLRYLLTAEGRVAIAALLAVRHTTPARLAA